MIIQEKIGVDTAENDPRKVLKIGTLSKARWSYMAVRAACAQTISDVQKIPQPASHSRTVKLDAFCGTFRGW